MAKELPYFKFEPSEWIAKDIQDCSLAAQGAFINICSYYWIRLGNLSYATALRRHCENDAKLMQELCDIDAIKVIDDKIIISFLDNQFDELSEISKVNSQNAKKGWEKRRKNATAYNSQSDRNAIRREENRIDKKKKEDIIPSFDDFLSYAKSKEPLISQKHLKYKYDAWKENGWKDLNDKKITNWKSKLNNNLQYIDKIKPNSGFTNASPVL